MFLGIDLGTSGVRACVLNANLKLVGFASQPYPTRNTKEAPGRHEQSPDLWWQTTLACLEQLPPTVLQQCLHICVDGTSGTIVACDASGEPLHPALMYNDARATHEAELITTLAPESSPTRSASSGLAKMLWLQRQCPEAFRFLHQADWLIGKLCGNFGLSDYNNALKSGYDLDALKWPDWITETGISPHLLPHVNAPGSRISEISDSAQRATGLPANAIIHAGTTDSIAAFLATEATNPGDAVTSLGSTLAIKLISDKPVFAPEFGIYSHRLNDRWLVGGASNSGGAALLRYFDTAEITELSKTMDDSETGLDYYPLPEDGERFPISDPAMESRVHPIPKDRSIFLKGLFEGIATIEANAYQKLSDLGATPPARIFTSGGGAQNALWTAIRCTKLGFPVVSTSSCDAACGTAKLASFNS